MQFNPNVFQQNLAQNTANRTPIGTPSFSPQFTQTLLNVAGIANPSAIAQSNRSQSQAFEKDKLKLPQHSQMSQEEEESIETTVRKMEQKLVKLARIERQILAGF